MGEIRDSCQTRTFKVPTAIYGIIVKNVISRPIERELSSHKLWYHDGVKYDCNHCDYNATDVINLKRHKLSQHDGIKYDCNDCDYKATTLDRLKRHKSAQHDGIKYDCNHCDY